MNLDIMAENQISPKYQYIEMICILLFLKISA
jgi:hypothetical protein